MQRFHRQWGLVPKAFRYAFVCHFLQPASSFVKAPAPVGVTVAAVPLGTPAWASARSSWASPSLRAASAALLSLLTLHSLSL